MRIVAMVLAFACAACSEEEHCYQREEPPADICERLPEACTPAPGAPPAVSELTQVVPSELMPPEVISQLSHNNLDVIWFENRVFFAFRTAPSHFAGDETVLYVVSSEDQQTWTYETSFFLATDLREPRFLIVGDRLFFYFAVLGYSPVSFEPQGAMVSEYQGPCQWSEPESIFEPGFIPWRARVIDGVSYLSGYVGGENIYEVDGEPLRVSWLKTTDGRNFEPVVPGQPVVLEGGTSETDFAFAPDGALIAVARNEAGDAIGGFGSKICRAEPGALGDWTCVYDPKKYDSPLLFRHGDDIWLIGRRQVSDTGNYDLFRRDLSLAEQANMYQIAYWTTPKRCALWRVDPVTLTVEHALDLPSNGDTCFASAIPLEGNEVLVYNYTSPLDDPDLSWVNGQTNPTLIYRVTLSLPQ